MNPQAKRQLEAKLRNGLVFVARALTADARKRATRNVDQGQRRNAITHLVEGNTVLWGIPKGSAPHALYLEPPGYKPHFVPARHLGSWPRRHGLKESKGLYVGGPGSSLQYGGAGARGRIGRGPVRTWQTKGGRSKYLANGNVGSPAVVPAWRELDPSKRRSAFLRGYRAK